MRAEGGEGEFKKLIIEESGEVSKKGVIIGKKNGRKKGGKTKRIWLPNGFYNATFHMEAVFLVLKLS